MSSRFPALTDPDWPVMGLAPSDHNIKISAPVVPGFVENQLETDFLADVKHGRILTQDMTGNATELLHPPI